MRVNPKPKYKKQPARRAYLTELIEAMDHRPSGQLSKLIERTGGYHDSPTIKLINEFYGVDPYGC